VSGIDKEKKSKALEAYLKNPYWKGQYENAPSEECKEYLLYTFCSSKYEGPDGDAEFDEWRKSAEDGLSVGDWEYLKKMLPNSPFVGYCDKKIKALK
jgi:hypothetical protein